MKRTGDSKQKPLWRKKSFEDSPSGLNKVHIPGIRKGVIKVNEKIRATVEELGEKIVEFDLVEPGDYNENDLQAAKSVTKEPPKTKPESKEAYSAVHKGFGKYDVVSSSGKIMNEKAMPADEAEALIDKLEQETIVEEEPE